MNPVHVLIETQRVISDPTEVTSCSAQFSTAVDTSRTVSGSCVVSKTFSRRDRYSCQWTENKSGVRTAMSVGTVSEHFLYK